MNRTRPTTSTIILWTAASLVAVASMTAILFGNSHSRKKLTATATATAAKKQRRTVNKKRNKTKEIPEENGQLSRVLQLRIQALTIPGMVNLGNTCFMAAVIQALAAQSTLLELLDHQCRLLTHWHMSINNPTFTTALHELLEELNQLSRKQRACSPSLLIKRLEKHANWLAGREEQDAHELFQLLSQLLSEDMHLMYDQLQIHSLTNATTKGEPNQKLPFKHASPFCGLLSSQLQCTDCGQTSVLRLYEFDSISLSLPHQWTCTLEDCLRAFARPEQIFDYECKRCSLQATRDRLATAKPTKKTQKIMKMIDHRLRDTIEPSIDDLPIPVERRKSRSVMKQTAVARGPRLLCLHLPRSTLFYGEAGKNACAVQFGQVLDLSVAYARNHWLPSNLSKASSQCAQYDNAMTGQHYQLTAVVEHLGSHMSGHFVTYRRVRASQLLTCVNAPSSISPTTVDDRWFRVSDRQVEPTTLDQVLTAQAYMLFYEQQDSI
ncbi:hypothetical protein BDF22DRAFT_744864 [Syncephalis plumigaleata]|nr:hypothetical protein BDF22DRAFT_744864 [Syncephalis plumigaleata]